MTSRYVPRFGEGPRYRDRLLTGRFPRSYSPTSPAYSPTSPACALRCRKPLFSLFVLVVDSRVSRSFPHRLADVRNSVSTSFVRCYVVARGVLEDGGGSGPCGNGPRGLLSARPGAHRSVFLPHRSPACGAQCNRSSPRFERGAPNFARAFTFLPRNTCRFADFASSGLQRPQTTFPSC